MKKLLLVAGLSLCATAVYAQGTTSATSSTSSTTTNLTSLDSGLASHPEVYTLSLRAPLIENSTFPVPVLYFDDLVGSGKLKATLDVPLRLTIHNSRQRRLLTLVTLDGKQAIPYGTSLSKLTTQVKLSTYKDSKSNQVVLTDFVGPNKKIFRTMQDGKDYTIDFILPITREHFHQGYVKLAIAASNGVELSQLCEVNESECAHTVLFRIVPRRVEFQTINSHFESDYPSLAPTQQKLLVTASNVDINLDLNNKHAAKINHKQLPFEITVPFIIPARSFNPHIATDYAHDSGKKTFVGHVDMYPIFHYMSNNSYDPTELIVETTAERGPDLRTKNSDKGVPLVKKLKELDNTAPFNEDPMNESTTMATTASATTTAATATAK